MWRKRNSVFNNIPITIRVTAWYSFFITILIVGLVLTSFIISNKLSRDSKKDDLKEAVQKFAMGVSDFEGFEDGIFFVQYEDEGEKIQGLLPKTFNELLPFSDGLVREFKNGDDVFFYYDLKKEDNEDQWIRGIIPVFQNNKEANKFLYTILVFFPFLLIFIVYGGYRIIKNAFKPVRQISETALEIQNKKDFSKRIDIGRGKDEIYKMANVFNKMLDSFEKSYNNEKRFNSDVSHELRTPVSVILSESEYAIKYADDIQEAKESFEVIKRQSNRMASLINQILELSKMEQLGEFEFEKFNFSEMLKTEIKDLEGILKLKNISLKENIEENIKINGNKIMIQRVLDNLISNAIKFTKDKVEINLYSKFENTILEVIDNGIGISDDDLKNIWNRFYQVEDSRNKDLNRGSGLGLSLVNKIAKIHGAEIEVESKVNQGSIFRVKF